MPPLNSSSLATCQDGGIDLDRTRSPYSTSVPRADRLPKRRVNQAEAWVNSQLASMVHSLVVADRRACP